MADRKDFYFEQTVSESELDAGFDALEAADQQTMVDQGLAQRADATGTPITDGTAPPIGAQNALFGGIMDGLKPPVAAFGYPLKIPVSAGTAYDPVGRRIHVETADVLDVSVAGDTSIGIMGTPSGGGSTAPNPGEYRWLTVMILFDRNLVDPRVDGAGADVFFTREESFRLRVKMGASFAAGSLPGLANRPPADPYTIILGDFLRDDTSVIDYTDVDPDKRPRYDRRGDFFRGAVDPLDDIPTELNETDETDPAEPLFIRRGIRDLILKLRGRLAITTSAFATHIDTASPTGLHKAKNISYEAGPAWSNGITNPAIVGGGVITDGVQGQIDKIIGDLASQSALNPGTDVIGGDEITQGALTIFAGTGREQLERLLDLLDDHIDSGGHPATAISTAAVAGVIFSLAGADLQTELASLISQLNTEASTYAKTDAANVFTPEKQEFNGGGLNADASIAVEVAQPASNDKKLLAQFLVGSTAKYIRFYAENEGTIATSGFSVTVNALWLGTGWTCDISGEAAMKLTLHDGTLTARGLSLLFKRGASPDTWNDTLSIDSTGGWEGETALSVPWDNVDDELSQAVLLPGGDWEVSGKASETTIRAKIQGVATAGGQVFSQALTFRHKFGVVPELTGNVTIDSDSNVSDVVADPTDFTVEGFIFSVVSAAAGAFAAERLYTFRTP